MAEERGGKKAGRGGRKSEGIRWRMVHDMSDGKKGHSTGTSTSQNSGACCGGEDAKKSR